MKATTTIIANIWNEAKETPIGVVLFVPIVVLTTLAITVGPFLLALIKLAARIFGFAIIIATVTSIVFGIAAGNIKLCLITFLALIIELSVIHIVRSVQNEVRTKRRA
jgi:hypothetical protein